MIAALRPAVLALALAATTARAADLPFAVAPAFSVEGRPAPSDGGGFRVDRVPVRPAPSRYDIYGYPLLRFPPDPLAAGGCPPALQPEYDAAGNLAGYAPLPMCR